MIVGFLILSFILDGVVYSLITQGSLIIPLFSLFSLVLIYPYFYNKDNLFLFSAFCLGIFYDIVYTNTPFLNTLVFVLIATLIIKIFSYFSRNIINTYLLSLIILIFYRGIIFLFLCLIQSINFDLLNLLESIMCSILANGIYISIFYLLLNKIGNKLKIKKIR
jgi:hypothetical protein